MDDSREGEREEESDVEVGERKYFTNQLSRSVTTCGAVYIGNGESASFYLLLLLSFVLEASAQSCDT